MPTDDVDGPSILRYVRQTAAEYGVEERVRFNRRVVSADYDSTDGAWTVQVQCTDTSETIEMRCSFLFVCTGYYRYDEGYTPPFAGVDRYCGTLVHPQHWPDQLDYAGRRVVVIGSGATAITLVPAMARTAEHVTMLQRSPSYVISLPSVDPLAALARRLLPEMLAYQLVRWKNVALMALSYRLSRRRPALSRRSFVAVCAHSCLTTSTSTRTSRRSMTRGTSACASFPTPTCSRRCEPGQRRSSPIGSRPSPSAA